MTKTTYIKLFRRGVLRASKALGLFRISRMLMRHKLLILAYHGFELEDESKFRAALFMRRETFEQRLRAIQHYGCNVLPLAEAFRRLQHDTLPIGSVCLTIDDGFYSALVHAAPLLRRYKFPATIYITSYYVNEGTPVFRLVLQYMFWKSEVESLDVTDTEWGISTVVDLHDNEARNRAIWRIIDFGENHCDEAGRERISIIVGHQLGIEYAMIKESRIMSLLTPKEVEQIERSGIDVQLHTHRHRLSVDDEQVVDREITENRRFLEGLVSHSLTHLCYPSGDWDARQWPWLERLGIETATTCKPGMNTASTPPLALNRVVDGDTVSQLEFEAEISGFSECIRMLFRRRHGVGLDRDTTV